MAIKIGNSTENINATRGNVMALALSVPDLLNYTEGDPLFLESSDGDVFLAEVDAIQGNLFYLEVV